MNSLQSVLFDPNGTIDKVRTLKFGDFQTTPPPCTLLSNRMTS